jgi:hypothetical protein
MAAPASNEPPAPKVKPVMSGAPAVAQKRDPADLGKVAADADLYVFTPDDVLPGRVGHACDVLMKAASVFRDDEPSGRTGRLGSDLAQFTQFAKTHRNVKLGNQMALTPPMGAPARTGDDPNTFAPSTDPTQLINDRATVAGMTRAPAAMPLPALGQAGMAGPPGLAGPPGNPMAGNAEILGSPIGTGKLGNGPGVGMSGAGTQQNMFGGGITATAADRYDGLVDKDLGDLTAKDRGDLGFDLHNRATGEKVSFFTQGGELGLMDWLSAKYPQGRASVGVLTGHWKAASCS